MERDFLEAPSQMLENWCWSRDTLQMMSAHYKTGEKIPDDMMDNLAHSRQANVGLLTLTQIFYATYDQRIHSMDKVKH